MITKDKTKITLRGIGVDAGLILVSDRDYFLSWKGTIQRDLSWVIDIEPGMYKVRWRIKNTWNGSVSGSGGLLVTSGKVVVSDPCYIVWDKLWEKWLAQTDFGRRPDTGTVVLDKMGGDGEYVVELDFKKIENE